DGTCYQSTAELTSLVINPSSMISYDTFVNHAITGKPDSEPEIRWSGDARNANGTHTVTITGNFPVGKPAILFKYSVPEPSRFAETVLVEALREKGVTVEMGTPGETRDFTKLAASYIPDQLVAEHISAPLKEEIKVTQIGRASCRERR